MCTWRGFNVSPDARHHLFTLSSSNGFSRRVVLRRGLLFRGDDPREPRRFVVPGISPWQHGSIKSGMPAVENWACRILSLENLQQFKSTQNYILKMTASGVPRFRVSLFLEINIKYTEHASYSSLATIKNTKPQCHRLNCLETKEKPKTLATKILDTHTLARHLCSFLSKEIQHSHSHTHSLNWLSLLLKAQRQQYISMSEGAQQLLCHRVQSPADNSHRSHTNKRKLI